MYLNCIVKGVINEIVGLGFREYSTLLLLRGLLSPIYVAPCIDGNNSRK